MAARTKQQYLEQLGSGSSTVRKSKLQSKTNVDAELVRERRLKNDNTEQDIRLKRVVLNRLFWFLGIETGLIFLFTLMQATSPFGFRLDEWSFNVLITATIAQIAGMLFVAVRYLFPGQKDE